MGIENLTPEEIVKVEIPTGVPIVYTFDETLRMEKREVLQHK